MLSLPPFTLGHGGARLLQQHRLNARVHLVPHALMTEIRGLDAGGREETRR